MSRRDLQCQHRIHLCCRMHSVPRGIFFHNFGCHSIKCLRELCCRHLQSHNIMHTVPRGDIQHQHWLYFLFGMYSMSCWIFFNRFRRHITKHMRTLCCRNILVHCGVNFMHSVQRWHLPTPTQEVHLHQPVNNAKQEPTTPAQGQHLPQHVLLVLVAMLPPPQVPRHQVLARSAQRDTIPRGTSCIP